MKNTLMDKRGTHVGIILSFVIFITFLIFIFTIVQPSLKTKGTKEPTLNNVEKELIKLISADVETVTISGFTVSGPCVELQDVSTWLPTNNLVIKDSQDNNQIYDKTTPGILEIDSNDKFFKILSASSFIDNSGTLSSCEVKTSAQYTVGLTKTNEHVFESEIVNLETVYNTDYENLKTTLKVPGDTEFNFKFTLSNGTLIAPPEKTISKDVFSVETQLPYLDSTGNILIGKLRTIIW